MSPPLVNTLLASKISGVVHPASGGSLSIGAGFDDGTGCWGIIFKINDVLFHLPEAHVPELLDWIRDAQSAAHLGRTTSVGTS